MAVKPPYDHTAVFPMPVVSVPQSAPMEGALPGAEFFPSELPADSWWVLYEAGPARGAVQMRGYPAVTTAEVRECLSGYLVNARGMGRPWPDLATSFDAAAQVVYIRYGRWLWTPAGIEAFARVA
ncbi:MULTISPECIES: hypothetical protein [unclassified Streptomyces]|uniref:hypothetical protein n=1 Tax=unclassified Streptomyces TaxID=2593676 RepID=UPI003333D755